jgi:hypothetical protein
MNIDIEISRPDLHRSVTVKSIPYDLVEFTIKQKCFGDDGKIITDSGYTTFYSTKEFKDFFQPLINELKARFDETDSIQN